MANFFALFKNSAPDIPSSLTKIGTPFRRGIPVEGNTYKDIYHTTIFSLIRGHPSALLDTVDLPGL